MEDTNARQSDQRHVSKSDKDRVPTELTLHKSSNAGADESRSYKDQQIHTDILPSDVYMPQNAATNFRCGGRSVPLSTLIELTVPNKEGNSQEPGVHYSDGTATWGYSGRARARARTTPEFAAAIGNDPSPRGRSVPLAFMNKEDEGNAEAAIETMASHEQKQPESSPINDLDKVALTSRRSRASADNPVCTNTSGKPLIPDYSKTSSSLLSPSSSTSSSSSSSSPSSSSSSSTGRARSRGTGKKQITKLYTASQETPVRLAVPSMNDELMPKPTSMASSPAQGFSQETRPSLNAITSTRNEQSSSARYTTPSSALMPNTSAACSLPESQPKSNSGPLASSEAKPGNSGPLASSEAKPGILPESDARSCFQQVHLHEKQPASPAATSAKPSIKIQTAVVSSITPHASENEMSNITSKVLVDDGYASTSTYAANVSPPKSKTNPAKGNRTPHFSTDFKVQYPYSILPEVDNMAMTDFILSAPPTNSNISYSAAEKQIMPSESLPCAKPGSASKQKTEEPSKVQMDQEGREVVHTDEQRNITMKAHAIQMAKEAMPASKQCADDTTDNSSNGDSKDHARLVHDEHVNNPDTAVGDGIHECMEEFLEDMGEGTSVLQHRKPTDESVCREKDTSDIRCELQYTSGKTDGSSSRDHEVQYSSEIESSSSAERNDKRRPEKLQKPRGVKKTVCHHQDVPSKHAVAIIQQEPAPNPPLGKVPLQAGVQYMPSLVGGSRTFSQDLSAHPSQCEEIQWTTDPVQSPMTSVQSGTEQCCTSVTQKTHKTFTRKSPRADERPSWEEWSLHYLKARQKNSPTSIQKVKSDDCTSQLQAQSPVGKEVSEQDTLSSTQLQAETESGCLTPTESTDDARNASTSPCQSQEIYDHLEKSISSFDDPDVPYVAIGNEHDHPRRILESLFSASSNFLVYSQSGEEGDYGRKQEGEAMKFLETLFTSSSNFLTLSQSKEAKDDVRKQSGICKKLLDPSNVSSSESWSSSENENEGNWISFLKSQTNSYLYRYLSQTYCSGSNVQSSSLVEDDSQWNQSDLSTSDSRNEDMLQLPVAPQETPSTLKDDSPLEATDLGLMKSLARGGTSQKEPVTAARELQQNNQHEYILQKETQHLLGVWLQELMRWQEELRLHEQRWQETQNNFQNDSLQKQADVQMQLVEGGQNNIVSMHDVEVQTEDESIGDQTDQIETNEKCTTNQNVQIQAEKEHSVKYQSIGVQTEEQCIADMNVELQFNEEHSVKCQNVEVQTEEEGIEDPNVELQGEDPRLKYHNVEVQTEQEEGEEEEGEEGEEESTEDETLDEETEDEQNIEDQRVDAVTEDEQGIRYQNVAVQTDEQLNENQDVEGLEEEEYSNKYQNVEVKTNEDQRIEDQDYIVEIEDEASIEEKHVPQASKHASLLNNIDAHELAQLQNKCGNDNAKIRARDLHQIPPKKHVVKEDKVLCHGNNLKRIKRSEEKGKLVEALKLQQSQQENELKLKEFMQKQLTDLYQRKYQSLRGTSSQNTDRQATSFAKPQGAGRAPWDENKLQYPHLPPLKMTVEEKNIYQQISLKGLVNDRQYSQFCKIRMVDSVDIQCIALKPHGRSASHFEVEPTSTLRTLRKYAQHHICAFLNSFGGLLLMGVYAEDGKEPVVVGIEGEHECLQHNIVSIIQEIQPSLLANKFDLRVVPVAEATEESYPSNRQLFVVELVVRQGDPGVMYNCFDSPNRAFVRREGMTQHVDHSSIIKEEWIKKLTYAYEREHERLQTHSIEFRNNNRFTLDLLEIQRSRASSLRKQIDRDRRSLKQQETRLMEEGGANIKTAWNAECHMSTVKKEAAELRAELADASAALKNELKALLVQYHTSEKLVTVMTNKKLAMAKLNNFYDLIYKSVEFAVEKIDADVAIRKLEHSISSA